MGKINQLTFAVANLIAAGEVVDRPASVVKELLENSIDSGADSITVEISRGGVALMRVCDNGCGISGEDLPLSIKRHATSKISGAEDLDSITTLGFRGEALAAISAVADVNIISKTKDIDYGHLLTSAAGGEVNVCEIGCADGTTVIVENIFANVPARRKFLKKDVTEAMAVTAVVEKIALSRPDISFTYIIDGQTRFSTAGDGKIKNTVYAVLGRDFAQRLVEVNREYDGIRVYGFIGRSDNCRANRNMQNFFINGRFVKSKTATAAIEQAYSSYLAEGKFPVCVLFITVSPMAVDVNVHPAKLEVKFSNEKAVFESVYYSVRSALESHTQKSEFQLPKSKYESDEKVKRTEVFSYNKPSNTITSVRGSTGGVNTFTPATNAFVPMPQGRYDRYSKSTLFNNSSILTLNATDAETVGFHIMNKEDNSNIDTESKSQADKPSVKPISEQREVVFSQVSDEIKSDISSDDSEDKDNTEISVHEKQPYQPPYYRIIGVCFNTYILVEQDGKLLIIDKHAAHERIIFEQLKQNLKKITHASQMMLLPIILHLSGEEYMAATDYSEEISSTGFVYSLDESEFTASITAIPDMLTIAGAQDVFLTMLDNLSHSIGDASMTRDAVYERALYQSACKAAVKGGRNDNEENIAWICDALMTIPDIKVCPHGRPVVTELDKRYIDRQFERIK